MSQPKRNNVRQRVPDRNRNSHACIARPPFITPCTPRDEDCIDGRYLVDVVRAHLLARARAYLVEYVRSPCRAKSHVIITASMAPVVSTRTDTLRLRQPSSGNGSEKLKSSAWNDSLSRQKKMSEPGKAAKERATATTHHQARKINVQSVSLLDDRSRNSEAHIY